VARRVFDVTGAGDTVIAALALGIVSGLTHVEAAFLANMAAGIVVGEVGTAAVSVDQLLAAIGDCCRER
jgi:D-beta-D-heptose 7-phosphate kinase/D-beta-D-heptose 1-phosphate adenosyltransferase